MSERINKILDLVEEHVEEKNKDTWKPGEDWVAYSGPTFTSDEYKAAIKVLLDGWLIFGENARQFEKEFAPRLGKKHGSLTNSGSSANLLMAASVLNSLMS